MARPKKRNLSPEDEITVSFTIRLTAEVYSYLKEVARYDRLQEDAWVQREVLRGLREASKGARRLPGRPRKIGPPIPENPRILDPYEIAANELPEAAMPETSFPRPVDLSNPPPIEKPPESKSGWPSFMLRRKP